MTSPISMRVASCPDKVQLDEKKIARAIASELRDRLQTKAPRRTGEFANSISVTETTTGAAVEPRGSRNVLIARVMKSRGQNPLEVTPDDQTASVGAGQAELKRQIKAGEARMRK